jgi:hypothetical protein
MARLLARMMAKRPDDRPASMEAVIAELDAVLAPPQSRNGWAITGLGLLAVVSAAGALSVWVTRHRQHPVAAPAALGAAPLNTVPVPPVVTGGPNVPPALAVGSTPAEAAPPTVAVTIQSEPPGAALVVGGRPRGVTPLRLALRQGVPVRLELSLKGYFTETRLVRPTDSQAVDIRLHSLPRAALPDLKESPY